MSAVRLDFVGILPVIEMNDSPSPTKMYHLPPQQMAMAYIEGRSDISIFLDRLRSFKRLTSAEVLRRFAALRGRK